MLRLARDSSRGHCARLDKNADSPEALCSGREPNSLLAASERVSIFQLFASNPLLAKPVAYKAFNRIDTPKILVDDLLVGDSDAEIIL